MAKHKNGKMTKRKFDDLKAFTDAGLSIAKVARSTGWSNTTVRYVSKANDYTDYEKSRVVRNKSSAGKGQVFGVPEGIQMVADPQQINQMPEKVTTEQLERHIQAMERAFRKLVNDTTQEIIDHIDSNTSPRSFFNRNRKFKV